MSDALVELYCAIVENSEKFPHCPHPGDLISLAGSIECMPAHFQGAAGLREAHRMGKDR
jgi:hypothetical protein